MLLPGSKGYVQRLYCCQAAHTAITCRCYHIHQRVLIPCVFSPYPASQPGACSSSTPQQSQKRMRPVRPITAPSWSSGALLLRTKPKAWRGAMNSFKRSRTFYYYWLSISGAVERRVGVCVCVHCFHRAVYWGGGTQGSVLTGDCTCGDAAKLSSMQVWHQHRMAGDYAIHPSTQTCRA